METPAGLAENTAASGNQEITNAATAPTGNQGGGTVADAAKEAMRRIKIGDEEVDEAEVIKVYQSRKEHQRAANKNYQDGLKAKKQAEQFITMMRDKGQLFKALEQLGYDPRQLAEEYLGGILEDEALDPKDRELKTLKSKVQEFEDQKKNQEDAEQKRQHEELKARHAKELSENFIEALKTEKLPPTKVMIARMASYIKRAAMIEYKMTPQEAAKLVKEDIENEHKFNFSESDGEGLARMLGEEGLKKIRAYDTGRLKDPSAHLKTPNEQSERSVERKRDRSNRLTTSEWRKFNRG